MHESLDLKRWNGIDSPTAAHAAARVGLPILPTRRSMVQAAYPKLKYFLTVGLKAKRRRMHAT
jgi:hypothetical protein